MKRGVFWCREHTSQEPELIAVSVSCVAFGAPQETAEFSAKSGENFNHRAEWEKFGKAVTKGLPFDTFPRGRVEIKNGKATVFLNPDLCREPVIERIVNAFELSTFREQGKLRLVADGSRHYRHRC